MDGEGSLDDLSSKDSHKDDRSGRMNLDTSRDPSVDSALSSTDGACTSSPASSTTQNPPLQRFSTNSTGDDEVAVKYNLREQFIDYIPRQRQLAQKNVVTCTVNANTSMLRNGANTEGSDRRGSDLQRQKPIVMRSISGGYESPKNCSTAGLQRAATTMAAMDTSSSSKNNDDDARKSKSQSMEDEPIMV